MRNAEFGIGRRGWGTGQARSPVIPHSAFRIPHSSAGGQRRGELETPDGRQVEAPGAAREEGDDRFLGVATEGRELVIVELAEELARHAVAPAQLAAQLAAALVDDAE